MDIKDSLTIRCDLRVYEYMQKGLTLHTHIGEVAKVLRYETPKLVKEKERPHQ